MHKDRGRSFSFGPTPSLGVGGTLSWLLFSKHFLLTVLRYLNSFYMLVLYLVFLAINYYFLDFSTPVPDQHQACRNLRLLRRGALPRNQ